ncbi:uncharacterized protein LOC128230702 [Mya arenaria]|uniref:uncharacterized protein LOC128230702 n=1 Tax=Mya arenaria TaxID=6604 RepID=UPI0022DF0092|nr:uncharacterized protein LOC128230702 [Mya arenaria]
MPGRGRPKGRKRKVTEAAEVREEEQPPARRLRQPPRVNLEAQLPQAPQIPLPDAELGNNNEGNVIDFHDIITRSHILHHLTTETVVPTGNRQSPSDTGCGLAGSGQGGEFQMGANFDGSMDMYRKIRHRYEVQSSAILRHDCRKSRNGTNIRFGDIIFSKKGSRQHCKFNGVGKADGFNSKKYPENSTTTVKETLDQESMLNEPNRNPSYVLRNSVLWHQTKVMIDELPLEMGFQPEMDEEFPTIPNGTPRIPYNIHQMWIKQNNTSYGENTSDLSVPDTYVDNMQSFMKHNPHWKYYFWTHSTARQLIADKHPYLLAFFDNATEAVVKADLIRYVAIYEIGGLYADLDTACLRPLDIVTKKYSCMLVLAPFENAACMSNQPYQICNGEFFCKPQHPFCKQILQEIGRKKLNAKNQFVIGPGFITGQYRIYQNISDKEQYRVDIHQNTTTPFMYKGALPDTDGAGIYIPNTRYFLDQPHPILKVGVKKRCSNVTAHNTLVKRMCAIVETRGFVREPGPFTFLNHDYSYSFSKVNQKKNKTCIPVRDIIPSFITYKIKRDVLGLLS